MKLHASAINKLVSLFNTYGGSVDELKLKRILEGVDFTPYERKEGKQDVILVLTEEYIKSLNKKG